MSGRRLTKTQTLHYSYLQGCLPIQIKSGLQHNDTMIEKEEPSGSPINEWMIKTSYKKKLATHNNGDIWLKKTQI